jgi:hypothetical protein
MVIDETSRQLTVAWNTAGSPRPATDPAAELAAGAGAAPGRATAGARPRPAANADNNTNGNAPMIHVSQSPRPHGIHLFVVICIGLLLAGTASAEDPLVRLQAAECDTQVIRTYKQQGRKAAVRQAQALNNIPCLKATMKLPNNAESEREDDRGSTQHAKVNRVILVSSATTINGLLDEIDEKVAEDSSGLGDLPYQWSEKAKPYIREGNFPRAYEKLLGLLKHYNNCKENHSGVYSENEISSNCRKYGPKVLLNTSNQDGQFLVVWDPEVFQDLVRDAHAETQKSPRPRNRQPTQPQRTWISLFSVVNKMSKKGWIDNASQHGIHAFEDKVAEQLASVGYNYSTHVSEDTRRAVATNPAWIWVAFADCRIFERRYKDAIENLVIAATKATEENQSIKTLIVHRLRQASEEADASGIPEYGSDNLEIMVNKLTDVQPPAWLLTALSEGVYEMGIESYSGDDTERGPKDDQANRNYVCNNFGTYVCDWFEKHWSDLEVLPYYKAIEDAAEDYKRPFIKEYFSDAANAKPDLFRIISAWDAAELGLEEPKGVQQADRWLLASIRSEEEAQELSKLYNTILINDEFPNWIKGAEEKHRRFILRHAVIRRAIELGCKQIATKEANKIIDSKYIDAFGESANKIAKLHIAVEKAIQNMPENNPNCGTGKD